MGKMAIGAFAVLVSSVAACDKAPSTAPSSTLAPPVDLQRLELEVEGARVVAQSPWGEAVVVRPGEAVQLKARGYLPDGSTRDVTSQASWVWLPDGENNFLGGQFAVHNGLVSAPACPAGDACRAMGAWVVIANYFSRVEARRNVLVLSEGNFALRGSVTEALSGRPLANAFVELRRSRGSFEPLTSTGENGQFRALGVPNAAEIRVSNGADYESIIQTLTLTSNESLLHFSLKSLHCGRAVPLVPTSAGAVTEIRDSLDSRCPSRAYDVTALSSGTLVGHLSWNPHLYGGG